MVDGKNQGRMHDEKKISTCHDDFHKKTQDRRFVMAKHKKSERKKELDRRRRRRRKRRKLRNKSLGTQDSDIVENEDPKENE